MTPLQREHEMMRRTFIAQALLNHQAKNGSFYKIDECKQKAEDVFNKMWPEPLPLAEDVSRETVENISKR